MNLLFIAQESIDASHSDGGILAWIPLIVMTLLLVVLFLWLISKAQNSTNKQFEYLNRALAQADETNRLLGELLEETRRQNKSNQ
jgi:hypothetical protein